MRAFPCHDSGKGDGRVDWRALVLRQLAAVSLDQDILPCTWPPAPGGARCSPEKGINPDRHHAPARHLSKRIQLTPSIQQPRVLRRGGEKATPALPALWIY